MRTADSVQAMKTGRTFALRKAAKPSPTKPSSIIAQVEGSGMLPGGSPPPPEQPAVVKHSETSNCFMDLKSPPVPARENVADVIATPREPGGSSKPSVPKSAFDLMPRNSKLAEAPSNRLTVAKRSPSKLLPVYLPAHEQPVPSERLVDVGEKIVVVQGPLLLGWFDFPEAVAGVHRNVCDRS